MRLLLPILLCTLIIPAYASNNAGGSVVCNQPYAICTTATCIPAPGIQGKAICFCNVEQGYSIGSKSCAERKPTTDKYGHQHITSSFSFANMQITKAMTCNQGSWTFCLDRPCLVDPRNANQAVCTCEIYHSSPFITMGGNCNTASCTSTLYSGATNEQIASGTLTLLKAMQLTNSPIQSCPNNQ